MEASNGMREVWKSNRTSRKLIFEHGFGRFCPAETDRRLCEGFFEIMSAMGQPVELKSLSGNLEWDQIFNRQDTDFGSYVAFISGEEV